MRIAAVLRSLGPIDAKSVRRDSFLRWMVIILPLISLLLRWLVPLITRQLADRLGFDLVPYYPLLISYFFVLLVPLMFGLVIGFLLLDEKDDNTLTALQVTPLSLVTYLAYRITAPMLLSIVLFIGVVPVSGLVKIGFWQLVVTAFAAAPMAPIFALFLASFADNKVQGFALMKGMGAVLIIPMGAYFVTSAWQLAFGIFPTFWPIRLYWALQAGEANALFYLLAGLAYQLVALRWLARRFDRVMHE